MRCKHRISFLSLVSVLSTTAWGVSVSGEENAQVHNANHIFNAIHSSLRQWGSSLNHNGMSMFVATVPEGLQVYHGTSKKEVVKGPEWLAFEPEHALIFARPRRGRGPPPGHGKPPGNGPPPHDEHTHEEGYHLHLTEGHASLLKEDHRPPPPPKGHPPPRKGHPPHAPPPPEDRDHLPPKDRHQPPGHSYRPHPPQDKAPHGQRPPPPAHHDRSGHQQPLLDQTLHVETQPQSEPSQPEPEPEPGYLQVFTTRHPLRLLYIDGMSAGKTSNGTLDTQDILLLNLTDSGRDGGMELEHERAARFCNLSRTVWQDKIDGVLRMEGGFEIILCDFETHLQVHEILPIVSDEFRGDAGGRRRGGGGGVKHSWILGGWSYIQAITSRYHGLGRSRVTLNYEDFVSVFAYSGLDLFNNDVHSDTAMPRLQHVDEAKLLEIRDAVTDMILRIDDNRDAQKQKHALSVKWQDVADLVVTRYSEPLHYLHTDPDIRNDTGSLERYLETILRPFIAVSERNTTLETERCVAQFVPPFSSSPSPPSSPSLVHRVMLSTTSQICSALLSALDSISSQQHIDHALAFIDALVQDLQWTSWKWCGACADEKVCFVPIWPMGVYEDHESPRCLGQGDFEGRPQDYWGGHW